MELMQESRQQGEPAPAAQACSQVVIGNDSKKYVYGIDGIAWLFGCSKPTANRIKKSGKIDAAITQIGRKIVVDAEKAIELAGIKTGGRGSRKQA
ncbi:MAG: DUF3853 family protein [Bacteroidaceae bacterium]|nr:DUF3853 family protein [Bacteroidaceae bacterium]